MKLSFLELRKQPRYANIVQWTKHLSVTGFSQILIQALSVFGGIFIVRSLTTTEYALYTLANTMLGTISVLADSGVSVSVMSIGGKVWQDRTQLGKVVVTGIQLRRKFVVISLLISIPILFYLLLNNSATWLNSTVIILALIPTIYAAIDDSLLEIPLKLVQDIRALQKNQIWANVIRFVMLAGSIFFLPFTFIAILANGLPRLWANIKLRKLADGHADLKQQVDEDVKKKVLEIVKRTLPGGIYYCISSQVTIWLISFFGSVKSLADVGALSRLGMILNIFVVLCSTVIIPRIARLEDNKWLLFKRFFQVQFILLTLSGVILTLVYYFPSQILLVLGNNYSGLSDEVLLIAISSCIGLMISVSYSMCSARGYVLPAYINIFGHILVQVVLIFLLDLSQTRSVLLFGIFSNLSLFLMYFGYFGFRVSRI